MATAYQQAATGSDPAVQATESPSVAELVRQATEQTQRLIRDEIRLAQLEVKEKAKRGGIAAGLFGGAGLVAVYAVGALIAAVTALIATQIQVWIAVFAVCGGLLLLAGLLALVGRGLLKRALPPVPKETLGRVRTDIATVKEHARR